MNSHRVTRGLGLLTAVTAIGSLTAPVAFAVPAEQLPHRSAAAPAKKLPAQPKDDFNGDGYQDLAVGSPQGRVGQEASAGFVSVVYGSKSGLKVPDKQILNQGAPGIPGTPRAFERFGESLTSADLNRDGYADLVVGAAGEAPRPGEEITGETLVVWGSAKGLARGTNPTARFNDSGSRLLAGDFDGDGAPDLVSAGYSEKLRTLHGPFGADGRPARESSAPVPSGNENEYWRLVDLRAGDVNGDGIADLVGLHEWRDEGPFWHSGLVSWKGTPGGPASYQFVQDHRRQLIPGATLDVGDVNKDGHDDVAVGLMYRTDYSGEIPTGGRVTFVRGSEQGLLGARNRVFHLDSPRVPGTPRSNSEFGASVTVGDLDGDGYGDIVVGATGATVDGKNRAGSVTTLRGTRNGPTSTGSRELHQNTKGVPGAAEPSDRFGSRTKMLDTDGDGRGELAVTASHEDYKAGAVWVFRTGKSGVTADGSFVHGPKALGLPADGGPMYGERYTS
ncbi:FG-GAP-like repeat-containing protein [Streptomyces sp. NPDC020141]|uniref:FG-GAP-like repeat-containing protein n=1 Tax=Streptomyces sp. NPDC020141 TaxID=3365065 RepID=UPI00379943D4